jgi:hypothetical protein
MPPLFQVLCERCFETQDLESEDLLPLSCRVCWGFGCFVGPYVVEGRITGEAAPVLRQSRFYAARGSGGVPITA